MQATMTERHAEFLRHRGYRVQDTQGFFDRMSEKDQRGFLEDFARWDRGEPDYDADD
jgi:hypothetical protein